MNIGNVFNGNDGKFTTRLSGIYEFSFSCFTTNIEVMKNDEVQLNLHSSEFVQMGNSFQMALNWGDWGDLKAGQGGFYSDEHYCRVFTGKFLRPQWRPI